MTNDGSPKPDAQPDAQPKSAADPVVEHVVEHVVKHVVEHAAKPEANPDAGGQSHPRAHTDIGSVAAAARPGGPRIEVRAQAGGVARVAATSHDQCQQGRPRQPLPALDSSILAHGLLQVCSKGIS